MGMPHMMRTFIAHWWYQDPKYVGQQPESLSRQLETQWGDFLNEIEAEAESDPGDKRGWDEYFEIVSIHQSVARSEGTEVVIITIFYKYATDPLVPQSSTPS